MLPTDTVEPFSSDRPSLSLKQYCVCLAAIHYLIGDRAANPIQTTVHPFPPTQINEALNLLRIGKIEGAAVLVVDERGSGEEGDCKILLYLSAST